MFSLFSFFNPAYYPLLIAAQVLCIIHAYKTGRRNWIYLLIFLPGIGVLIYLFMEILPDIRRGEFVPTLQRWITPHYRIRAWEQRIRVSDTVFNRLNLAKAYEERDLPAKAIPLVMSCLEDDLYARDPDIMLQLARLLFEDGKYAESLAQFSKAWPLQPPGLRKMEDELIYSRALEASGALPQAEEAYQRIIRVHHSLEAMYWYGLFLKKQGRPEEAMAQFRSAREEIRLYPRYARRRYMQWVRLSRREMLSKKG